MRQYGSKKSRDGPIDQSISDVISVHDTNGQMHGWENANSAYILLV